MKRTQVIEAAGLLRLRDLARSAVVESAYLKDGRTATVDVKGPNEHSCVILELDRDLYETVLNALWERATTRLRLLEVEGI